MILQYITIYYNILHILQLPLQPFATMRSFVPWIASAMIGNTEREDSI